MVEPGICGLPKTSDRFGQSEKGQPKSCPFSFIVPENTHCITDNCEETHVRSFSQYLILLMFTCGLSAEASTDCQTGAPEDRLSCLTSSHCPDVASEKDLAECYRQITLILLSAGQTTSTINAPHRQPLTESVTQPQTTSNIPPGSTDTGPAEVTTVQDDSSFGYEWHEAPRERQVLQEINSKIVFLQTMALGNYLIGLENGQLWQQLTKSRTRLKTGEQVRIVRGSLRSFKLFPEKSSSTNVNRVICHGDEPSSLCAPFESWQQQSAQPEAS